jgi:hypothetical protein
MALDQAAFEAPWVLPRAAAPSPYVDIGPLDAGEAFDSGWTVPSTEHLADPTSAFPNPATAQFANPATALSANPATALSANPATAQFPNPATALSADPATAQFANPTTAQFVGPTTVSPPNSASPLESAAFSCERSPPLCAWARSSEEAAFIAVLEMREVAP